MAKGSSVETWIPGEEDAHERTADKETVGLPLFSSPALSTIVSRWLDLAHPQHPKTTPAMREARRICGRWIAHRRRMLNLSVERLARTIGGSADAVHLVELGLAEEQTLAPDARERLTCMLVDAQGEDWPVGVVAIACGRYDVSAQEIVARAAAALREEVAASTVSIAPVSPD